MKKKSLKINMILNILKQCCNIIIPLIIYPYVSRVLGASNYGKYSFADSVINVFMTIACLGVPTYAVREGARLRDNKKAIEKFTAEVYSINILSLIFTMIVLIAVVENNFRLHKDALVIYLLSFNIITSILGRDWLNNIFENFAYITVRYIFFQLVAVCLIFFCIKNSDDYIEYTCITLVANSGGYILNFFYTQKFVHLQITTKLNLKKHMPSILFLWGVSLAIQIYIMSDVIILGFFQSDAQVGIYSLSSKVYTIVKALLNAIIIVTIPRISSYIDDPYSNDCQNIIKKLRSALYILVLPSVVGLFMESKNIILLIGGEEYVTGAMVIRILCIALVFAVFGCFYAQAILVPTRNDKSFFVATVISASVNILLNFLIIPRMGICGAAITTVIAEGCVMLICMFASKRIYYIKKDNEVWGIILGCAGIVVMCILTELLNFNYLIKLLLSIVLSSIIYVFIITVCKNAEILKMWNIIFEQLKRVKKIRNRRKD